jgi:hypothetical protein
MSVIRIKVDNEVARITDETTEDITSSDIGTVDIEFSFSSEWNDCKKTALLYKGLYDQNEAVWILISEDVVKGEDIPPELFSTPGFLSIGIFGDDDSGHRVTTNIVTKRIDAGTPAEDIEEQIDYSLYNQIIRQLIILERNTEEFDKKYADSLTEIQNTLDNAINQISVQINGHIANINSTTNANLNSVNNVANTAINNINQNVNNGITNINETVNSHIANINEIVNGHIENINAVANAGIENINKLVSDYYTKAEIDALIENVRKE